jgi:UPF0042 nucleotide-binding protein
MSGSGKSVALHVLEDTGYYCVDNLPPELLPSLVALTLQRGDRRLAIAMDVRSSKSLPLVPALLADLNAQGVSLRSLFLDATTATLVRRFSESRRRHPLSIQSDNERNRMLVDAIALEREMLGSLREHSVVIDTSLIPTGQLLGYVKALVSVPPAHMTMVFESFAFKRGIPVDADFLFDVRMLPNPHYEPELRLLTGLDDEVAKFLMNQESVQRMITQIAEFLLACLEPLVQNHRSYVTVAIGCTGGQHRSVFIVESLARLFGEKWFTLTRHRELDAK